MRVSKSHLRFNGLILQKIYSLVGPDGREIAQIQAANVSEAFTLGRDEYGDEVRAAYLLPERKEARFVR